MRGPSAGIAGVDVRRFASGVKDMLSRIGIAGNCVKPIGRGRICWLRGSRPRPYARRAQCLRLHPGRPPSPRASHKRPSLKHRPGGLMTSHPGGVPGGCQGSPTPGAGVVAPPTQPSLFPEPPHEGRRGYDARPLGSPKIFHGIGFSPGVGDPWLPPGTPPGCMGSASTIRAHLVRPARNRIRRNEANALTETKPTPRSLQPRRSQRLLHLLRTEANTPNSNR